MIRGYVAVVAGDSSSADILPDSTSCKKTTIKLATADVNRFEFYISIKGTDYSFKVIGNVRIVDKHNIASGFLRIGFIVPNLDIVVSSNPQELEAFVYTLVAVKDHRVLPPMCSDSTHKQKLKCTYIRSKHECCECPVASYLEGLCSFCCFHILQCYSHDDAHKILNSWKSSVQIRAPVMRRLSSITVNTYPYLKKISASSSGLVEIPEALGSLPCLTALNLSYSRLGQATNWNWLTSPFLRENLCELYLARNQLHSIPETILGLRNLKRLDFSENHLTELPTSLGSLKFLRELNISQNKLVILPGWMYRKERLSVLDTSGNEFDEAIDMFNIVAKPQLQRNEFQTVTVPSLFKTVATYIVANSLAFWEYNIPTMITEYLKAAYICRCDSVVFPDTTGPVVQCWINEKALAISNNNDFPSTFNRDIFVAYCCPLPIAIRCCSYECYKRIEPFFVDGNADLL